MLFKPKVILSPIVVPAHVSESAISAVSVSGYTVLENGFDLYRLKFKSLRYDRASDSFVGVQDRAWVVRKIADGKVVRSESWYRRADCVVRAIEGLVY